MCKCKQKKYYSVEAEIDENAMGMGYDGDIDENEDTSEWVAYQLISYVKCSRCELMEGIDSLGAVWVLPYQLTGDVLNNTIITYDMVPKGADYDLNY